MHVNVIPFAMIYPFTEGIEEPLKNNPNVHDVMIIEP